MTQSPLIHTANEPESQKRHAHLYLIVGTVCISVIVGIYLTRLQVPAAFLSTGMIAGLILTFIRKTPVTLSSRSSTIISTLVGVLLGTYLDVSDIDQMKMSTFYIVLLSCSTIIVGLILAKIMVLRNLLDSKTAVLGLLPGGSAGAIAAAQEFGAETEIVGFMQYARVLFVTLTAPIVYKFISVSYADTSSVSHQSGNTLSYFRFVVRGDQIAGICTTIVIALVGYQLAKKLRIPSASLFGPMLLSLIITLTGCTHGYAASGITKDIIFTLVGLEVGLKFSQATLIKLYKLVPIIMLNIIILCAISGALSIALANILSLPASDLYLATTPGGINAVLGIAQESQNNLSIITSTQSIRLVLSLMLLSPLIKLVNRPYKNPAQLDQ